MELEPHAPQADSSAPWLTILIPTYNREDYVSHLVNVLARQTRRHAASIELVVADNASADGTAERLKAAEAVVPNLRIHHQPRHYPTAEENLLGAIPSCRGEFVWSMSDDDEPLDGAVERVLELIRDTSTDFFLSNLSISSQQGGLLLGRLAGEVEDAAFEDFASMARDFGLVTTASCFSASIFRKSVLVAGGWEDLVALSPIYSHAFAYCRAFRNSRCEFISDPLVRYRFEGTPLSAWGDVSSKRSQQFYFPWTTGLSRLISTLVREEVIDSHYFHRVIELGITGQFALARSVLQTFCDQLLRWISTHSAQERVPVSDFEELAAQYSGAEQGTIEALSQLRRAVVFLNSLWPVEGPASLRYGAATADVATMLAPLPGDVRREVESAWIGQLTQRISHLRAALSSTLAAHRIDWGDHSIFQVAGTFYAVPRPLGRHGREPQFFYAEALAKDYPRAPTLEGLKKKIEATWASRPALPSSGRAWPSTPFDGMGETTIFDAADFSWPADWIESWSTFVGGANESDAVRPPQNAARVGRSFENALLWSSDLTKPNWESNRLSVRPTGQRLSDYVETFELIDDSVFGDHFLVQTAALPRCETATLSWVLKAGSRRHAWIRLMRGADVVEVVVNVSSCEVLSATAAGATVEGHACADVGDGFRRAMVKVRFSEPSAEAATCMVFPLDDILSASYEGSGQPALTVAAPQLTAVAGEPPFCLTDDAPVPPTRETFGFPVTLGEEPTTLRARFMVPEGEFSAGALCVVFDSSDRALASVEVDDDRSLTLRVAKTRVKLGVLLTDRLCDWAIQFSEGEIAMRSAEGRVGGSARLDVLLGDVLTLAFGAADNGSVAPLRLVGLSELVAPTLDN